MTDLTDRDEPPLPVNTQNIERQTDVTLLNEVMETYGGIDRWKELHSITIQQTVGGVLWPLKQVDGILNESTVEILVQEQRAWHRPFTAPHLRSSYSPYRVAIETDDEAAVEQASLDEPRASFFGHTLETPWTTLQLAYFAGYAMWTYLSEPYSLTFEGVDTEELGSWKENGQTWRRLGVRYPDSIGTHSTDQVLYVDSDGLLRRRDYQLDIGGGGGAAHYMDDHRQFKGIVVPVKRVVHGRDDEDRTVPEPVTVTIDINEVLVK